MVQAKPRSESWWIDSELVFDRPMTAGDDLIMLQEVLVRAAPQWVSKLRIWLGPRDQRPIDAASPGALRDAVIAAAAARGPTYHGLVEHYGRPANERIAGSVELRGAGPELVIVATVDECAASPLGPKTDLGNTVALQIRSRVIEGQERAEWARKTFETLCARLAPAWGMASHPDEYWQKVMTTSAGIEAVGRDFGRFLPGLFWLNFFGRRHVDLIGEHILRSAPAHEVLKFDSGILLSLAPDPECWRSLSYEQAEARVLDQLGRQFFFSSSDPDRPTVAPDWARTPDRSGAAVAAVERQAPGSEPGQ